MMIKKFHIRLRSLLTACLLASVSLYAVAQSNNLAEEVFREIPAGCIKPLGWLQQQLQIMANGSSGHLDEIHPKIAKDNGWLGGKGDGWEETPYWLDGAVPLAYLLNDAALKEKVLKYINWTLNHQRPSGYFGPITKDEREKKIEIAENNCQSGEDWWPKMVMLKVLQQYYLATNDARVVPFMSKYFAYQLNTLEKCPLGKWTEWATSRGADNVMIVQWLYNITKDPKLLTLAEKITAQSFAWSTWLGNRNWVMHAAAYQGDSAWMTRHAVNVGMGLKAPAISYQRTKNEQLLGSLKTGWNDLMLLHGLPMGIFSGDEDLHGNDPTQGVELCAIVEVMFSLEQIIAITGDVQYMDALEKMTFNALPTQTTDDYNMKQYFQIANQVQVSRGAFDFSLPFDREMTNVFGLRSGYTCCTANMHQGWAKFASHLWYRTADNGLAALQYSPNEMTTKVGDQEVTIIEHTDYPFSSVIEFEIKTTKEVSFPLHLRIPSWCKNAAIAVNGQDVSTGPGSHQADDRLHRIPSGGIAVIEHQWKNNDRITLRLPMEVRASTWGRNSRAIERGPLVYALKLGEKWEKGSEPTEGDYFSVYPTGDWNYGILESVIKDPSQLKVTTRPLTYPFVWNQQHAPITIVAPARKIPGWKAIDGVAYQPVSERGGLYRGKVSPVTEEIELIPYGFTKVRIVAFPVVK